MTEQLGNIKTDSNKLSGHYTSIEWKSMNLENQIKLYVPTMGNPLLEEKENKNYTFEAKKPVNPVECTH